MRYRTLSFLLLFINLTNLYGQKNDSHFSLVEGTLYSKLDSTTIPFANIYLKGTTIGSHSNEEGQFSFKFLNNKNTEDTVVISCIGYEDLHLLVSGLNAKDSIYYLSPKNGMLKEVIVKPSKDTLRAIVEKAIKKIPFNYPRRAFLLKGFYRELVTNEKEYVRVLEAAVSIQDNGFDVPYTRLKIRLDEVKKSEDYINYSFFDEIYNYFMGVDENNLYKSFEFDFIRGYNREQKYKFLRDIYNRYDFELDSIMQSEEGLIYVLNYFSPTFHMGGLQQSGKIYINANDYGIIKLEYQHHFIPVEDSDEDRFKNGEDLFLNTIHKQSVVSYRKIGKKYYLSYIKWKSPVGGAWLTETEEGETAVQFYDAAFYVTDVKTRRRDFKRIKNNETIAIDQDLFKVEKSYNKDFWNDFNSVIIDPKLEKAKQDLKQFEN